MTLFELTAVTGDVRREADYLAGAYEAHCAACWGCVETAAACDDGHLISLLLDLADSRLRGERMGVAA